MIYLDTSYIAKCYLNEPGTEEVQALVTRTPALYSCEWARLELHAAVHRQWREENLKAADVIKVLARFSSEEKAGFWRWIPITTSLLDSAARFLGKLPRSAFVRAGDALHLACAASHGFKEIYSNDRRLLAAARHFGLKGVNVIK